jgi:D-alanine-D-alanine ligase
VVVLHSLAMGLQRGRPEDLIADEETARVAQAVAEALRPQVRSVEMVGTWDDVYGALKDFDPARHVVFNLCESLGGRAFSDAESARILERLGFCCTGASYLGLRLSSDKSEAKKVLEAGGLATPRYRLVRRPGQSLADFPLPAIVKPTAEGGSLGISHDSVVTDRNALRERVAYVIATYRQPALVEEFVAGRELNVALWGNGRVEVLPISEIRFEWTDDPLRQIVSFASKWLSDSVEYWGTPGVCPAPLSPTEGRRVQSAASRAYRLLGLRGYARVDMRLRDGVPYVLEVNANPDLAPEAGFFRSARTAGHSYQSMVGYILRLALAAHI